MAKLLFPDAQLRSPTAVQGKSDMRDENIYTAVVLQHGGAGTTKVYTTPQGQAIPALRGSAITAATSPHQVTYSELTTNISQAGQLGAALGEASFRSIGINVETGYYSAAGALNTYGAGQQEVQEILGKTFFQLRIAGKLQIQGPSLAFPASGGAFGNMASTANAVTMANLSNGWPSSLRRLKLPIMVARTDTVEGTFGIAGGDSLVFSVTSGIGQPCLTWINIHSLVKGDAR